MLEQIYRAMVSLAERKDTPISVDDARDLLYYHLCELGHTMYIDGFPVVGVADAEFLYATPYDTHRFALPDEAEVSVWRDYKGQPIGLEVGQYSEPYKVLVVNHIQFRGIVPLATQFLPED
jgi:hypothetical protein